MTTEQQNKKINMSRSSDIIKAIRKRTGLSQAAFAEKFEIPKRTLENWESGTREPPIYILRMLDVLADHPDFP